MMNIRLSVYKQKYCTVLLLFLVANSVAITQPPTTPLIEKTKSSMSSALGSTIKKIQGIKVEALVERLLTRIQGLGTQINDVKDCMLAHTGCTSAKRAAFIATGVAILALTAAIVGFTITVAATSKEQREELNKAVETTSHEVKDWKPAAIFKRLGNKLAQFKQNLLSMKTCLIKRQCTKKQKRALYATAATISALVMITIGLGVGSYIYAQKKKQKEQQAEIQAAVELAALQVSTAQTTAASEIIDGALKELDQNPEAEPIKISMSPFQQKIVAGINLVKRGTTFIQEQAAEIKKILQEKAEKANQALREVTDKVKQANLLKESKELLDQAKEKARTFVMKLKAATMESISDLAQTILGVSLTQLTQAGSVIQKIKQYSEAIRTSLAALSTASINQQMQALTSNVTAFSNKVFSLLSQFTFKTEEDKLTAALEAKMVEYMSAVLKQKINASQEEIRKVKTEAARKAIEDRLATEAFDPVKKINLQFTERERQAKTAEAKTIVRKELLDALDQAFRDFLRSEGLPVPAVPEEQKYPFWTTLKEVWVEYPKILNQLNGLQIKEAGTSVATVLTKTALTLETLLELKQDLQSDIVSNDLAQQLNILQTQLRTLATSLNTLTAITPIINTSGKVPQNIALMYATVKNMVKGKFGTLLTDIGQDSGKIKIQGELLTNQLANLQNLNAKLFNIQELIKNQLLLQFESAQENALLRNVAHAPSLFLNAFGASVTSIKKNIINIVDSLSKVILHLSTILQNADHLLRTLNNFMGSTPDNPFITPQVINAIEPIASVTQGMSMILKKITTLAEQEQQELSSQTLVTLP